MQPINNTYCDMFKLFIKEYNDII